MGNNRIGISLAVAVFLVACSTGLLAQAGNPSPATDYFPADTWRRSTPEAQGLSSRIMVGMFDQIKSKKLEIHSILVIRHGYLVLEANVEPFTSKTRHTINSATKSVVSALVGIALAEGKIKSLDQKMVDFFPGVDIKNLDEAKKSITIQQLLTMSSGIAMDNGEAAGDNKAHSYLISKNRTAHYLNSPMMAAPGANFNYDNAGVDMLAKIVHQASGVPIAEYAKTKLLSPLGIHDFNWELDPQEADMGFRGLSMGTGDMAKIGYLYLKNGSWNGQQVISTDYVAQSFSNRIKTSHMQGMPDSWYGNLWWGLPFGGYAAAGFGGQYIMTIPNCDMVVVFTADLAPENAWAPVELVRLQVIRSIAAETAIPENPVAWKKLSAAIQTFNHSARVKASVVPGIAAQVSGRTFTFDSDKYPWKSVSLSFDQSGDGTCRIVIMGDKTSGIKIDRATSLDGRCQEQVIGKSESVLSRGYWTDESTFVVDYYEQAHRENRKTWVFQFADPDSISLMAPMILGNFGEKIRILTGKAQ